MLGVQDIDFEKCGDIIVAPRHNVFALTCSLCHDVFLHFAEFRTHITNEHDVYLGFSHFSVDNREVEGEDQEADENSVQGNEFNDKAVTTQNGDRNNDTGGLVEDDETQNPNTVTIEKSNDIEKLQEKERETANVTKDTTASVLEPIDTENNQTNLALIEENQKSTECNKGNYIEGNKCQMQNDEEKESKDMAQIKGSIESVQAMEVDEMEENPEEENLQKSKSSPIKDMVSELENRGMNKNTKDKDNMPSFQIEEKIDGETSNNTSEKPNEEINQDVQTFEKKETPKEAESKGQTPQNNDENEEIIAEDTNAEPKIIENENREGRNNIPSIDKGESYLTTLTKNDSKIEGNGNIGQECKINMTENASENSLQNRETNSDMEIDEELTLKATNISEIRSKDRTTNEISKDKDLKRIVEETSEPFQMTDSQDQGTSQNNEQNFKAPEIDVVQIDNDEPVKKNVNENYSTNNEAQSKKELVSIHKGGNITSQLKTEKEPNPCLTQNENEKGVDELMDDVEPPKAAKNESNSADSQAQNEIELVSVEKESNIEPQKETEKDPKPCLRENENEKYVDELMDDVEPPKAAKNENNSADSQAQSEIALVLDDKDGNINPQMETEKDSKPCLRENENENCDVVMDNVESRKKLQNKKHYQKSTMEVEKTENEKYGKRAKLDEPESLLNSESGQPRLIENEENGTQLNKRPEESIKIDSKGEPQTNEKGPKTISERRKSIKLAEIFEDLDLELDEEDEDMKVFESLMLREDSDDGNDEEEEYAPNKEDQNAQKSHEVAKEEIKKGNEFSRGSCKNDTTKVLCEQKGNGKKTAAQSVVQSKTTNLINANVNASKTVADGSICDKYVDDLPIAIEEEDAKAEKEMNEKIICSEKENSKYLTQEIDPTDVQSDKENNIKNNSLSKLAKNKIPLRNNFMNNSIKKSEDKINEAIDKIKSDIQTAMSPKLRSLVQTTLTNSPARNCSAINKINTPKSQNQISNVDTPRPTFPINRSILNSKKRRLSAESGHTLNSTRSLSPSVDMENVRKMPKLDDLDKKPIQTFSSYASQQKPIQTSSSYASQQKPTRKPNQNSNQNNSIPEAKTISIDSGEKKLYQKSSQKFKSQYQAVMGTIERRRRSEIETLTDAEKPEGQKIKESFNLPKSISITRIVVAEENRPSSSKTMMPAKSVEKIEIRNVTELPNWDKSLPLDKNNIPQCSQKQEKNMEMRRLPVTSKSPKPGDDLTLSDSLKPTDPKTRLRKRNELKEDDDVIEELFDQVAKESNGESNALSSDEQDEAPKIVKFDAKYDAMLLRRVGLNIISDSDYESKSSIDERKKSEGLAMQFARLLQQSSLMNRAPDKDNNNEKFPALLKSLNRILPKPELELFELKRIIFLITNWYMDIISALHSEKKPIPLQFEKYVRMFSFIPKISRRVFHCEYCNVWFFAVQKLVTHRASHFEPLNGMACVHCTKIFKRSKALELHEEKCKFKKKN